MNRLKLLFLAISSLNFLIVMESAGQEPCGGARAHLAGESLYYSDQGPLLVLEGVKKDSEQIVLQMHSVRIGETPIESDNEISIRVKIYRQEYLPTEEKTNGAVKLLPQQRSKKPIIEMGPYSFKDNYENRFTHYYLHKEIYLPLESLTQK